MALAALRKYIDSRTSITDQEFEQISALFLRKLRRHQYLLQEGDVWRYHAFVVKGCLRTYTVDSKGDEHIVSFAAENWWPGDCDSLLSGLPTVYNIDAIEDCEILLISKADFENIFLRIPAINHMVNEMYQKGFIAAQSRINAFLTYTAEEKYNYFVTKYPAFATRVPQHMIASYLGITPETLSRIRKQALRITAKAS